MSYNGSGLFQINTSGQPVVAGTVITASAFNALTADLATGLTTAITKDGQTATTAQIPFAQGLRSTLTTDSTTSTSGSIITDGGLGVAKAITAGTTITGTKLIPTGTSVTGNGMYLPATNSVGISTAGVNAVTIDASQNVGVGVTPSAWGTLKGFEIVGGASFGSAYNSIYLAGNAYFNGTNWIYKATDEAAMYSINNTNGSHQWNTAASGTAGNAITFTQAMTLDASGNWILGTTSQIGSGKTSIVFNGATQNAIETQDSGTNSGAAFFSARNSGATQIGSITRVGTTNAVIYNTSSDYRLKTVLGSVSGSGERIDALKPIDYQWTEEGSNARGFLAHEFKEVYANSVTGEKDAVDADGNPIYQAMQASTPEVMADLVAEIQSLRKRLAALENK
jgi:hypothetical protein